MIGTKCIYVCAGRRAIDSFGEKQHRFVAVKVTKIQNPY